MEQNNDYIGCCIAEETAALTIEDRTLLKCVSDKNYVYIPDGVERIASNAFAECKNLYAICSRECLRENVMEVMHSCMLNCAYGTESWLEKRIDKYTNADMSLWLWEVSDVDYTYALQQCIRNSKYHNKAGNSIQWQSLSVDMNDLLNHTIDESIASQLPIILPTDPFRVMYSKRLEQAYSLPEEIARLGFGILRITGINKKELTRWRN